MSIKKFICRAASTSFLKAIFELDNNNNTNNSNNSHDNVCGAVIMTKVTARVHPVHLMNVHCE